MHPSGGVNRAVAALGGAHQAQRVVHRRWLPTSHRLRRVCLTADHRHALRVAQAQRDASIASIGSAHKGKDWGWRHGCHPVRHIELPVIPAKAAGHAGCTPHACCTDCAGPVAARAHLRKVAGARRPGQGRRGHRLNTVGAAGRRVFTRPTTRGLAQPVRRWPLRRPPLRLAPRP